MYAVAVRSAHLSDSWASCFRCAHHVAALHCRPITFRDGPYRWRMRLKRTPEQHQEQVARCSSDWREIRSSVRRCSVRCPATGCCLLITSTRWCHHQLQQPDLASLHLPLLMSLQPLLLLPQVLSVASALISILASSCCSPPMTRASPADFSTCVRFCTAYIPFTRSNKHRANIKQAWRKPAPLAEMYM